MGCCATKDNRSDATDDEGEGGVLPDKRPLRKEGEAARAEEDAAAAAAAAAAAPTQQQPGDTANLLSPNLLAQGPGDGGSSYGRVSGGPDADAVLQALQDEIVGEEMEEFEEGPEEGEEYDDRGYPEDYYESRKFLGATDADGVVIQSPTSPQIATRMDIALNAMNLLLPTQQGGEGSEGAGDDGAAREKEASAPAASASRPGAGGALAASVVSKRSSGGRSGGRGSGSLAGSPRKKQGAADGAAAVGRRGSAASSAATTRGSPQDEMPLPTMAVSPPPEAALQTAEAVAVVSAPASSAASESAPVPAPAAPVSAEATASGEVYQVGAALRVRPLGGARAVLLAKEGEAYTVGVRLPEAEQGPSGGGGGGGGGAVATLEVGRADIVFEAAGWDGDDDDEEEGGGALVPGAPVRVRSLDHRAATVREAQGDGVFLVELCDASASLLRPAHRSDLAPAPDLLLRRRIAELEQQRGGGSGGGGGEGHLRRQPLVPPSPLAEPVAQPLAAPAGARMLLLPPASSASRRPRLVAGSSVRILRHATAAAAAPAHAATAAATGVALEDIAHDDSEEGCDGGDSDGGDDGSAAAPATAAGRAARQRRGPGAAAASRMSPPRRRRMVRVGVVANGTVTEELVDASDVVGVGGGGGSGGGGGGEVAVVGGGEGEVAAAAPYASFSKVTDPLLTGDVSPLYAPGTMEPSLRKLAETMEACGDLVRTCHHYSRRELPPQPRRRQQQTEAGGRPLIGEVTVSSPCYVCGLAGHVPHHSPLCVPP